MEHHFFPLHLPPPRTEVFLLTQSTHIALPCLKPFRRRIQTSFWLLYTTHSVISLLIWPRHTTHLCVSFHCLPLPEQLCPSWFTWTHSSKLSPKAPLQTGASSVIPHPWPHRTRAVFLSSARLKEALIVRDVVQFILLPHHPAQRQECIITHLFIVTNKQKHSNSVKVT
jgi:hypothetical protein